MIPIGEPRDIGETIALLRTLQRLTQRGLAAASGVRQTQVALYEVGGAIPGLANTIALLAALGHRLAVVPAEESGPETALSASVGAEHGSGVDGSRGGDSNGSTGRTGVDRASWVAGYDRAVAVLRGVAARSGSEAARWAADYLAADPDRWRMNEDCWHSTDGSECPGSGPNCAPGGAA